MQFLKNEKINRTLYDDFLDTTFPGERDLENSPDFDGKDEYFFEENNPSDTIFAVRYENEIEDNPTHSWKAECSYYVCRVPEEEEDIYILFSISWDDNWSRYERTIEGAIEGCKTHEIAKTILLKKYAIDNLSSIGRGEFGDFILGLLN